MEYDAAYRIKAQSAAKQMENRLKVSEQPGEKHIVQNCWLIKNTDAGKREKKIYTPQEGSLHHKF